MNNQTKTQENVKKALAKQTLGLPLTPHEHALVTLYGQSPVQQKENKPEFVEKYLKPLVVALGVGVVNVVYRKTSEHDEIVTLIYENGFTTDKDVSADSLSALTCDTIKGLCRAAEILNESELARLNKYNAEHGTSFVPIWDKTNDPKN